ncbi:iron-containing alcohol dehydrogenase [Pseudomonas alloputida]|uniref:Iron-containing alcohol dehydrogenase n=1 Tax=Pseudomonas alloputida TaxID=1940621 RepID=A0ABY3D6L1_9PSED|nr:iron-containing alcohol dehydrogenase [Pseudomonas alloputida]TRZ61280.1 iron-containing alcohol dehydrogenase [Pseudomonas alloputida]
MKAFQASLPVKLDFEVGAIRRMGEKVAPYGNKVLLMVDPFLQGSELVAQVLGSFAERGISAVEFYDIVPNPRHTTIDRAVALVRDSGCQVVVAIGGGSAIDSAKAVAFVAVHGRSCWDYTERLGEPVTRPQARGLPLLVVPTTSGTGTEATPFAVINNPGLGLKCAIVNPHIYPDVALIDPQILVSKPPRLTALTAVDTFCHALEAYISIHATPWVEMVALEAIRLFAANALRCVEQGDDLEARARMAFASTLGGMAIAGAGVTVSHALGQPLGAMTDAPHGGTVAASTAQVIRWTLPVAAGKFARVAEILDPSTHTLPEGQRASRLPEIVSAHFARLGVRDTFGSYGLKPEQVDEFAQVVWTSFNQDLACHPKPIRDQQEVAEIVRQCL